VVVCLQRGADLHVSQLMPLPLTVSCFSKIQIGFTFLVPAHLGSPGKGPLNGCVVCASYDLTVLLHQRVSYGGRAFAIAGTSTWNTAVFLFFQYGRRPPSWICYTHIWTTHDEYLIVLFHCAKFCVDWFNGSTINTVG